MAADRHFFGQNVPRDARLLTRRIASPTSKMADKIDKGVKRKRHESKTFKPSKKVAIEDDRKIKISFQEAEKWAPIVGTDSSHDRRQPLVALLMLPSRSCLNFNSFIGQLLCSSLNTLQAVY